MGSSYGLRTTLVGYDAVADDANDVNKFSFNSDWTDIVRVHKYGYVDPPSPVPSWPGPTPGAIDDSSALFTRNNPWLVAVAHTLGYIPFVEARVVNGNTIYDDYRKFSKINGTGTGDWEFNGERAWAYSDVAKINTWSNTDYDGSSYIYYGCRVGYIIYEIPVTA
jgi:hypothetical protein